MPSAFLLRRFYLVFLYFLCWLNPSYQNQKSQKISTSLFMTPYLLCWVTTLYIFCPSFEKGHSKDTCPSFFFFLNNFNFGHTGSSFLHTGFLLAAASGDHFLVAVHGLLIAAASPTAEYGLQDTIGFSSGGRWAQ